MGEEVAWNNKPEGSMLTYSAPFILSGGDVCSFLVATSRAAAELCYPPSIESSSNKERVEAPFRFWWDFFPSSVPFKSLVQCFLFYFPYLFSNVVTFDRVDIVKRDASLRWFSRRRIRHHSASRISLSLFPLRWYWWAARAAVRIQRTR